MFREEIRNIEVFTCRTEIPDEAVADYVKHDNVNKLIHGLKKFVKTQAFTRYVGDLGYVESKIHLADIKDDLFKESERRHRTAEYEYKVILHKITTYNELPWWKKMLIFNV